MLHVALLLVFAFCVSAQTSCAVAPAVPEDRRANQEKLRFATFNAEWLFAGADGKSPWTTKAEADEHLFHVAAAVAAINPDMMGLQEVQNCEMLIRLIDQLALRGVTGYKPYLIQGTDTATGQNVGLITRVDPSGDVTRSENRVAFPVPGSKCGYTGANSTSGVSKHFIAPVTVNGVRYTFFNLHFVAFPTTPDRCAQREAQASVMRGLINSAMAADTEIVVFGDYNDYSGVVPDVADDVPTSRVLNFLSAGLPSETATDPTLFEVSSLLTQSERYTSIYDVDKLSQIDHLLVSKNVANNIFNVDIPHSLYVGGTTSDHWPFVCDVYTPAP